MELFNKLRDETSISALYISHDLGLVSQVAEKVSVLKAGEIVESGPLSEVFGSPREPYTKALLGSLPNPKNWLGAIEPTPEAQALISAEKKQLC